jgi:SAM-dependent methyltransferase
MKLDNVDLIHFPTRTHRIEYMVSIFGRVLAGRVLDIGCASATLRSLRPDLEYIGVDMSDEADLRIDLEAIEHLPFDERSFEAVVCCDVLEHLDNLHQIFAEVVRVSKRYVIVSLPNCWAAARRPIARGKGGVGHYGLPPSPPPDRHKWFFSLTEAHEFAVAMAAQHGLAIVESRVAEKPRPIPVRLARRLRHPKQTRYLNRFAHTLFVLFERTSSPSR